MNMLKEIIKNTKFWKNHDLVWLPTTTSTNDDLKSIWRNPDFSHKIEVADLQTQGKGQYERKWASSNVGQCLMFSFTLDIKEYEFPLSMIAGASLAVALDKLGLKISDFWLKWPNDIWVNDRKLSGILTESTTIANGFRSVIGIGINILPLPDKSVNAVSLSESGVNTTREEVLTLFLRAFDEVMALSVSEQVELWKKYSGQFWKRKFKALIPSSQSIIITPVSINNDGALIAKTTDNKEKTIMAASLMPI